ncbi:MAG: DDE transposase family protein [Potamolinea sp.]
MAINDSQSWYIVKRNEGQCEIVPSEEAENKESPDVVERWGSFDSKNEAIARRVGLIRALKCKPV